MRRKLKTKKGQKCYALSKQLPESVFGQIEQARRFRQFLLRGMKKGEQRMAACLYRAQSTKAICSAQAEIKLDSTLSLRR